MKFKDSPGSCRFSSTFVVVKMVSRVTHLDDRFKNSVRKNIKESLEEELMSNQDFENAV